MIQNPLRVLMEELTKSANETNNKNINKKNTSSKNKMSVELLRQCKDGNLIPVTENQMSGIDIQAAIASVAGALLNMTHEEKTAWAIETKNYANAVKKIIIIIILIY